MPKPAASFIKEFDGVIQRVAGDVLAQSIQFCQLDLQAISHRADSLRVLRSVVHATPSTKTPLAYASVGTHALIKLCARKKR